MSLINEALRKARKEAAEAKHPPASQPPPQRRGKSGVPWAPILIAALLAALLGSLISWWLLRKEATATSHAKQSMAETAPIHVAPPAEVPRPREHTGRDRRPGTTTFRPDGILTEKTEATPTLAPAMKATPTPTPHAPAPRPVPEKTIFTAEATIDGHHLSLDYLVFRKEQPFAQINGVTVGQGGIIEGFRLEEIEEDRIILQREGKNYTILVFN